MISQAKHLALNLMLSGTLLATYACSHMEVEEIPVTANPTEEIGKLEAQHKEALHQQVNMLSPTTFRNATAALAEAKKSRDSGEETKAILKYVAEGNAYLKRANEVAGISRTTLGDVTQRRADAVIAGAPNFVKEKFDKLDATLVNVTEDIEDKDLAAADKAKAELIKGYSDVELQAIKTDKLGSAGKTIEQAINEGAKENASRTLAEAVKAKSDAEAFIVANRHDKVGIDRHATAATASAQRVLDISRQVKVVDKKDSEAILLETEAQQKLLAKEKASLKNRESELNSAEATAASLGAKNEELAGEKRFQERLETAKALFSSKEATVYRDGNKLVIRMKSLAFPTGKSMLAPGNFAVLAKVQKVMQDLGDSHVTIEGHTDSTGAKDLNKRLSAERAEAIEAYFVANGIGKSSLSTVGHGDSKPITSNNSSQGRAENRRVDVIIEPTPQ